MSDQATQTICMVLSEHLSNHYVGPLVRGATSAAAELGVRLLLYSPLNIYLDRRDFSLAYLPLLPRRVDAYLLPVNVADEVVTYCRATGARMLTYAGQRPGVSMIGPDNRGAARAATEHLIAHGRRRIAHLAGLPDSDEARARWTGYRDALAAAGIAYDPALVADGYFRVQEAEDATARLLRDGPRFDAIFAANDLEARGAINVLLHAGLRVPEDVAVIGFDDSHGSDSMDPPLTTVRQSAFQLGWQALHLLTGSPGRPLPTQTTLNAQLVVRRSCGCPWPNPSRDPRAELAERFAAGQAPLVSAAELQAWTDPLDQVLLGADDLARAVAAAIERVESHGGNPDALRDYLEHWRTSQIAQGADRLWAARRSGAAKDALALELEARITYERLERGRRLNSIGYVLDLLREYHDTQSVEPVLRYMVAGGPIGALSAQGGSGQISAQLMRTSSAESWHGPSAAFPPPGWLGPGEVLLLMPMKALAQQHMLFGLIERPGRAHVDLDDQMLRTINTYRSLTVLDATLRELDAARAVQLSLLPHRPPDTQYYDIAGATRPALQVGGDLFGYYVLPDGGLALALGDVAGKGLSAALLMSACATALAGAAQSGLPPGPTLVQIHRTLKPSIGRGQNAAICLVYLDGQHARMANAGAVAPILRDYHGVRLVDVGGLPLGTPLSEQRPYAEAALALTPGDLLVLTSDGIVEAMNASGELYGFERLLNAIARAPHDSAQAILNFLFDAVLDFCGDAEPHDDMAVVVARYRG